MGVEDYPASAAPWPGAIEWSRGELRRYLDAVADLDPSVPTVCTQWTVSGLTAHLAATFRRFGDMLERGRAGSMRPPFAPEELSGENLRAVREFTGDPVSALDVAAGSFLDAVRSPEELMPHQRGPIPVALQVMFGLNELAVHHDDLAPATGVRYRPGNKIEVALAGMYDAVFDLPGGDDPWFRLLRATGREPEPDSR
ncbi:uncharacterized protein (TIGR03083 family) [Herbihabitans rhizosphaerae]|uniref:Uncharacterized protein (TIGR03083 family) n=1 Tax=Herbihabitans rhizosphaerae TaxID=1872711 RepID=A0A4V2ETE5_9PSEU|nr:uncharacterized protein (TIGR03083 family) [Herbihabitans rhizosphaerae]